MTNRIPYRLMLILAGLAIGPAQASVRVALIGSALSESGEGVMGLADISMTGRLDRLDDTPDGVEPNQEEMNYQ